MPRSPMPWFRVYVEITSDQKVRRLKPEQRWLFIALLSFARRADFDGNLMVSERISATIPDLADIAGMTRTATKKGVDAMLELGLLETVDGAGTLRIPRFSDRQFESDRVTKRTRKHRSKEQDRNVPTSFDGTGLERTRDRAETETETETEPPVVPQTKPTVKAEQLNGSSPPAAREYSTQFETWWKLYPRKIDKPDAFNAWKKARKRASVETITAGLEAHLVPWETFEDRFIPHASTWLNRDGWDDDPPEPRGRPQSKADRDLDDVQDLYQRTLDEENRHSQIVDVSLASLPSAQTD